jgi:hypothetical protein
MKKYFLILMVTAAVASLMLSACKSDYERLVERELASGVRHDSIFMGIYLGMSAKDFYAQCWELNKQKLIRQGNSNTSVLYEMTELKHKADMNFYPTFNGDKILEMPVIFSYTAWAPWNKELWSDSLILDVKNLMEKWYGPGFIKLEHPEKGIRWVKVDGNRRIMLWKEDDQQVKALYTDLTMEDELNAEKLANKNAADKKS